MKKIVSVILSLMMFITLPFIAFSQEEITSAASEQPRLMVTSYSIEEGSVTAGKQKKLSVTVSNMHKSIDVKNVKITYSDESGSVAVQGVSSVYCERIAHLSSFVWNFNVKASANAEEGNHTVSVMCEYQAPSGEMLTSSDSLIIPVKQTKNRSEETTQNTSQPRFMVTDYSVENGYISPDGASAVSITLKNTSKVKEIRNIKLSVSDETGDLKAEKIGTKYIDKIKPAGEYTWRIRLNASKIAQIGEHAVSVVCEYEDINGTAYSSSDSIRVNVKQISDLDFSGLQLPAKVIQGETQTIEISLMNTGKSLIRNCKIDFDIDSLEIGGSVLVGEIPVGETKTASVNLRVSESKIGSVEGKATVSYEDEFSDSFDKTENLSTFIEKKVIEQEPEEKKEEKKNPLWWAFALGGALAGGIIGCVVPVIVYSDKQRKEDEKRL